ncbi:MAG: CidA/LrgA family protein [Sporomusaceae bacterium]|nr:CidA/LrgA family protein [Sporomusaceae bacterium]
MNFAKMLLQVILLCGLSWLGNELSQIIPLAIPGNIWGLAILYILLEYKIIPIHWVELGAGILISELLLFFIPSAIGVVRFQTLLLNQASYLLIAIIASTAIVLLSVGLLTEGALKYRRRRRQYVRSI